MLNGVRPDGRSLIGLNSLYGPAGVAFANLEIPITDAGIATSHKTGADVAARNQYILKASPLHAPEVSKAGIDLVSLGNNHAMDYQVAGLKQMTGLLDKLGVGHTGAGGNLEDAMHVAVHRAPDGRRVGLISSLAFKSFGGAYATTPATEASPGVMYLRFEGKVDEKARAFIHDWVAKARTQCDFLVVALHWGIERQPVPSPYQVALGRAFIDEGADVVWGHHPHVLEGAELYKGKPIMYSMGNLVSPSGGSTGLIRMFFREGKFVAAKFFAASIGGGRTRLTGGTSGVMHSLSQRLEKAFPSPDAKPLF